MRMLTLNCHSLLNYDSDKQIQEIVDQIVREEVDVFVVAGSESVALCNGNH